MSALVQFKEISYRVSGRVILESINLSVEEGETLVLLGRSGSGKTTLLKMVNRLVEPTAGEVIFKAKPVRTYDVIQLRRQIGYVIQEAGLFPHITVARNVTLVPELQAWPPQKITDRATELLETIGLNPQTYGQRYPARLSGGERQRVGIARALAANPDVLLLDEPFSALDPVTRFEMQKQFLVLRDRFKKTAIFVTHDIREAMLVGSRIALLNQGRIEIVTSAKDFVGAGTPEAQAFLATLQMPENVNLHEQHAGS